MPHSDSSSTELARTTEPRRPEDSRVSSCAGGPAGPVRAFEQLEQVDRELLAAGLGDFPTIEAMLAKRAAVIQQATQAMDALRQPTAEHHAALVRSREAGAQAMRQLILAKHLLSTELSLIRQEQRLWDSLAGQSHSPSRVDCRG